MPHLYCPRILLTLLLLLVVLLPSFASAASQPATAATQAVDVHNPLLALRFSRENGQLQDWLVTPRNPADSYNLAAPQHQLVKLDGYINGKTLDQWAAEARGWSLVEHSEDKITLALATPHLPLQILAHWKLATDSTQAKLALSFILADEKYRLQPDDRIFLTIGPGMDEIAREQTGIGSGMYAFTDIIYQANQQITALTLSPALPTFRFPATYKLPHWFGMHSRHFAFLLEPLNNLAKQATWQATLATPQSAGKLKPVISIQLPIATLDARHAQTYTWKLYGGSKSLNSLHAANPEFADIPYNSLWQWMRTLVLLLENILQLLSLPSGSPGLAIILLALIIRLFIHPLAANAMRANKNYSLFRATVKDEIASIYRNFKGGEQRERILQLFAKHKISPPAALKPLLVFLVQMPVIIALFYLFGESCEWRHTGFLWISDLTEPDHWLALGFSMPYLGSYLNILPVFTGLTMALNIKQALPHPASPAGAFSQEILLLAITLIFIVLFYPLPSGTLLYWSTASLLQLLHYLK